MEHTDKLFAKFKDSVFKDKEGIVKEEFVQSSANHFSFDPKIIRYSLLLSAIVIDQLENFQVN